MGLRVRFMPVSLISKHRPYVVFRTVQGSGLRTCEVQNDCMPQPMVPSPIVQGIRLIGTWEISVAMGIHTYMQGGCELTWIGGCAGFA